MSMPGSNIGDSVRRHNEPEERSPVTRVLSIGTLLPATSNWHPGATWQSWPLLAMIDECSGTAASEVNGSSSEEPVRSDTVTNVLQITVQFTLF
jgi:hypothetical protein